jgi:uncharacterized membrane protein YphA (DoxX/SURF4 family)
VRRTALASLFQPLGAVAALSGLIKLINRISCVAATLIRFLYAALPQAMFEFRGNSSVPSANLFVYSPSADGQRFLVNLDASEEEPALNVIVNWEKAAGGTKPVYDTLVKAKVPFPHLMTYFVSVVEFVGGSLLTVGFLSSPACVALLIDMAVATLTSALSTMPKGLSPLNWLDDFLYLTEVLYVLFFF